MYVHEVQIRVRYGETDQMGYLYYGNYAEYFEVGRVEMIRSLGLTYKELEEVHGIWLPVVSLDMRFVRPAFYDELLTVRTTLRRLPDTHIVFHVEIFNEKMKLVNGGRVRLCFFDAKTKKVVQAPEILLAPLRGYFGGAERKPFWQFVV
ncbi:MAG: acyl-CoA thioesterase [Chitinophagales bacterium]|nr:acyl-CoA thioesterase [Chitinophagales bacterium]